MPPHLHKLIVIHHDAIVQSLGMAMEMAMEMEIEMEMEMALYQNKIKQIRHAK